MNKNQIKPDFPPIKCRKFCLLYSKVVFFFLLLIHGNSEQWCENHYNLKYLLNTGENGCSLLKCRRFCKCWSIQQELLGKYFWLIYCPNFYIKIVNLAQQKDFIDFGKFLKCFAFSFAYLSSRNYPVVCFLPLKCELWEQAFSHYVQLYAQNLKVGRHSIN